MKGPGDLSPTEREAVGAVVSRDTAKRPKRLLQLLGQSREALTAKDDADMFPPTNLQRL